MFAPVGYWTPPSRCAQYCRMSRGSAVTRSSNKQAAVHQMIYTPRGDESVCAVQVTHSAILLDLLYLKWSGKENQMIGCMVSPEPAVRRTLPDSSPRSGGTASQRDSPQFRCGAATHLRRAPTRLFASPSGHPGLSHQPEPQLTGLRRGRTAASGCSPHRPISMKSVHMPCS